MQEQWWIGLGLFIQHETSVYHTESRRYAPDVRYHLQLLCKHFFLVYRLLRHGGVIQSAAFFSNVSQTNEKSLIFTTFLFFIVFFICYIMFL